MQIVYHAYTDTWHMDILNLCLFSLFLVSPKKANSELVLEAINVFMLGSERAKVHNGPL